MMKQTDLIILKAFLIALEQLDEPLPETQQSQLNAIAENVTENLIQLDKIANGYPQLNTLYQEVRLALQDYAATRSKNDFPLIDDAAEENSTENNNFLLPSPSLSDSNGEKQSLSSRSQQIWHMDVKELLQKAKELFPNKTHY